MDNDYVVNLDDILRTIESAEVVRIRFLLLDKRLLIDNRHNEFEGPLVRIVSRSGSSEESFRSLKRMRPRFPLPEKMTAIWWPKYVNTLYSTGVWNAIVQRGFEVVEDPGRRCSRGQRRLGGGALPDGLEAFAHDGVADFALLELEQLLQDGVALVDALVEPGSGDALDDRAPDASAVKGVHVLRPPDRRHLLGQRKAWAHAREATEALFR